MCIPRRPQPDGYDSLLRVTAHFYATPPLTLVPRGHRYNEARGSSIVDEVRIAVGKIYRTHDLRRCPRYGLYFSGSKAMVEDKDNDTIMLLVIELKQQDIEKWWKIDGEVRQILEDWSLSGDSGVCVRYYLFNAHATVEETIFAEPLEGDDTTESMAGPTAGAGNSEAITRPVGSDLTRIPYYWLTNSGTLQIRENNSANIWSPPLVHRPTYFPMATAEPGRQHLSPNPLPPRHARRSPLRFSDNALSLMRERAAHG